VSLKRSAATGSLLLLVGQSAVYGASFVRNMILARLLTTADFGIAATFSLIIMMLELSAKLSLPLCVIQDEDGDQPEFVASAHLLQSLVAILSAVVIAAAAAPLALMFGIPGQRWAIVLLAFVSLFRGFEHLDIRRYERHLRFAPSLLVEAVPQIVTAVAAWPVALWFGDYRAVLVLLLAKGLTSCVWSHVVAERPYRWGLHRIFIVRMLRFGWPLLLNGFLMFGVVQGDQFIVAVSYTMTELGPYAAAAALTMAPMFFFGRVFNSITLPVMAGVQHDLAVFARRYRQFLAVATLFASVCAFGMVLGAEALMRLVYGAKYAGAGVLLAWLSAGNAFRNLRFVSSAAAIAKGDTRNELFGNSARVIGLAPALALGLAHAPLWSIASTAVFGEALACCVTFVRLKRRHAIPLATSLVPAAWALVPIGTAGTLALLGFHRLPAVLGLFLAAVGACAVAGAIVPVLPELRGEASRLHSQWREAGWRGCFDGLKGTGTPAKTVTF
jgi:O-antigen/teichoic acid export membrane protein